MRLFAFLCLIFVLFFVAAIPAQQVVTGVVLDSSGQPAAKAVVRSVKLAEKSVTTDEQGRFTISVPTLSRWTDLWAFSANEMELGQHRFRTEEGKPSIPEFTIRMTQHARVITGTVFDYEGNPVAGALVSGDNNNAWFGGRCPSLCTTGSDGTFCFLWEKKVPLLRIYAIKEGVGFNVVGTMEWYEDGNVPSPEEIIDGPFSITLKKPQTVRVHVTDIDEKPLGGITICVGGISRESGRSVEFDNPRDANASFLSTYFGPSVFQVKTDEKGDAVFNWIPSEGFTGIDFSTPTTLSHFTDAVGKTTDFGYGTTYYSFKNPRDMTIKLPKTARLEGKVVYSDGTPVSWVRVAISYEHARAIRYADADGNFVYNDNPGTAVNIGIESTREAAPGVFQIDLGDGSEVKRQTFHLKKGTKLHGIVFNRDMTPCVDNFRIMIEEKHPDPTRNDPDYRETTREECLQLGGMYEFTLPPGSFEINATCGYFRSTSQAFKISPDDEEIWVDLQLKGLHCDE